MGRPVIHSAGVSSIYILNFTYKLSLSPTQISIETDPDETETTDIIPMMCELYSLPSLLLVTCLGLSVSLPAQDRCSHQYRGEDSLSVWEEILLSGTFLPSPHPARHHLTRLSHKLAELEAVIDHNKDQYSKQVFGYSFKEINTDLHSVEYKSIFSEVYETQPGEGGVFSEAYEKYQTLHLATELIQHDLEYHEAQEDVIQLWSNISSLLLDIIKNLYAEVVTSDAPLSAPLQRSRMPRSLKCVHHSSYRDTRDFVILRHILRISRTSLDIFDNN